jgi:hypothetical protein
MIATVEVREHRVRRCDSICTGGRILRWPARVGGQPLTDPSAQALKAEGWWAPPACSGYGAQEALAARRVRPRMRTEALRLKPPLTCLASMLSTVFFFRRRGATLTS